MNLFLDALGWLFTPENWGGASGISSRLQQHLYFTLAVVAVACVLAFPPGWPSATRGAGWRWFPWSPHRRVPSRPSVC